MRVIQRMLKSFMFGCLYNNNIDVDESLHLIYILTQLKMYQKHEPSLVGNGRTQYV